MTIVSLCRFPKSYLCATKMMDMRTFWKKLSQEEIESRVFTALKGNVNYDLENILGIPASYLDDKVFNQDSSFLKQAPYISTLVHNPNHIGCHTIGTSESFFAGTQEIERELINVAAVDILNAEPDACDGYVASGGTEANIQAIWTNRNYFVQEFGAEYDEIAILCNEDSHYSMDKASNLLGIGIYKAAVNFDTRLTSEELVDAQVSQAKSEGKKYFIVVCNMMTTMYGSVDSVSDYTNVLRAQGVQFRVHIDGAYGGFYYPFAAGKHDLDFSNPDVYSVTLDAHKMAQAPYGTGIFIARKGLINYANTKEASYIVGEDCTLIGSRSGANAVAIWMILMKNGPYGWQEKIFILQKRTDWMCKALKTLGIEFYRNDASNIITIKSSFVKPETAAKFGLVPDNHHSPNWFKIVLMEHVTIEKLQLLVADLKAQ